MDDHKKGCAADPFDVSFCVIPNANAGLTDIDKRSIANQSHCDVKLANMPLSRRD